ncbi:MAG TPA: hypothetical protein DEQ47_13595 [Solibacterales bacterium]|nr:hypothetical protein [Bryobacterales bacterium]
MLKAIPALLLVLCPAFALDATGSLRQALALFNSGKYAESFDLASQCLRQNHENAAALKILGMDQFMLGHPREALAAMTRASELAPSDADAFYYLGRLYFSADNAVAALAAFEKALALDSASVRAHNGLGQTYEALGRRAEAESAYRQAMAIETDQPKPSEWPAYNLGALYLNDGRTDEAIACFRRALQVNPAFPEARVKLAVALSKDHAAPESFELLREVLRADPRNAEAHYRLALLLTKAGKPDEARKHFELFETYRK